MRRNVLHVLPDPYIDRVVIDPAISAGAGAWTTGTWSNSANRAMYLPCVFPVRCTLYALRFLGGNTTGNYDLGVYDEKFNRLASKGSTAMSAAIQTLTLPELVVPAGTLLYAALALSNTSGTLARISFSTTWPAEAGGCASEDSALPLPSSGTPVSTAIPSIPLFAWGVR